jgi:hypothetical protein
MCFDLVKKVVLQGPFENIPEGVVLVDTPGLGDAVRTRSYRTTSITESMDEIWMLSYCFENNSRRYSMEQKLLPIVEQNSNHKKSTIRVCLLNVGCHSIEGQDTTLQVPGLPLIIWQRLLAVLAFS